MSQFAGPKCAAASSTSAAESRSSAASASALPTRRYVLRKRCTGASGYSRAAGTGSRASPVACQVSAARAVTPVRASSSRTGRPPRSSSAGEVSTPAIRTSVTAAPPMCSWAAAASVSTWKVYAPSAGGSIHPLHAAPMAGAAAVPGGSVAPPGPKSIPGTTSTRCCASPVTS